MPGIITTLLTNWRLVLPLLAVLLIGGSLFYLYHKATVAELTADRDIAQADAKIAKDNLELIQRVSKAQNKAIEQMQIKEREQDDAQQNINETIRNSPSSDDAPAAPVLDRVFDELRRIQGDK